MIKQQFFLSFKKIKATELCEGQRVWHRHTVCVDVVSGTVTFHESATPCNVKMLGATWRCVEMLPGALTLFPNSCFSLYDAA